MKPFVGKKKVVFRLVSSITTLLVTKCVCLQFSVGHVTYIGFLELCFGWRQLPVGSGNVTDGSSESEPEQLCCKTKTISLKRL